MAGLAPPIHAFIFDFAFKTWMPATSTRMTLRGAGWGPRGVLRRFRASLAGISRPLWIYDHQLNGAFFYCLARGHSFLMT